MPRPPELSILEEDWNQTPPAVQAVVIALWQQVQTLQAQVATLQAEVAQLREQVGRNSQNSSQPPSADPPSAPARPARVPSGRQPGGQKGHTGHGRKLISVEQVHNLIDLKPTTCDHCGALLLGEDAQPVRHQVTELPRVEPEVTEYRQHTLTCLACGTQTHAELPPEIPAGSFGPRLQALVSYLTGRIGVSQRDVVEILHTIFHTELSLGSIPAHEDRVSAALADPVHAAQTYVQDQPVQNVDETHWPEKTKRAWLWISTTPLVTLFLVIATRGASGAQQLLGTVVKSIVGSDRWSGYTWLDPARRQVCWAHLKRDFQALVERGGESERIGRAVLEQVEKMFGLWHRVRDGTLSRAAFQTAMDPIQARIGDLLREGAALACDTPSGLPPRSGGHGQTRHTCTNILKLEVALWTFVRLEGVEPTNNSAERGLRRAVLWRRRSFGTHSEDGSRFVERILTTVTTLRQQHRDVLDYLTEACAAAIRGDKAPSLLPDISISKNRV